jgi:hypothetical protein
MKKEKKNWEKLWSEFVVKEMCPAKCGHLRFKLKNLIKRILAQEKQKYRQEILDRLPKEREKDFGVIGNDAGKVYELGKQFGFNSALQEIKELIK